MSYHFYKETKGDKELNNIPTDNESTPERHPTKQRKTVTF